MSVRAAFLDAGNTLVELDYALVAVRLGEVGYPATPAAVRRAEERARVRLDPHVGGSRSTEAPDVFQLYVRYVLDGLGIPWTDDTARLTETLRAVKPYGLWSVPVPGAAEVLEALRRTGLRLAVVSNSTGIVAELLRAVGLASHLDAIVDSAVVGAEKPDPRIFRHAAAALDVRPEEAVHVGDLYSVDVVGARAAGCRAILLDPAGAWGTAECPKAADLAGAARLIAAMAAR